MFSHFIHFFFFVEELHLGLQHITHSTHRQQGVPAKGRIITAVPEKERESVKREREREIKHELSDSVQFQSTSIVNTAHHSSIACVTFPDFSQVTFSGVNKKSDDNGGGHETKCRGGSPAAEEKSGSLLAATWMQKTTWAFPVGKWLEQVSTTHTHSVFEGSPPPPLVASE